MKLRRNDNVVVVRGKDRGKQGRILSVDRKHGRLVIDSVNTIKKHVRPSPTVRQAGIVEMPASINASKVKLICPACSMAGRLAIRVIKFGEGGEERRRKMRVCKACNQEIE